MSELTMEEVGYLQSQVAPGTYKAQVVALFTSGRATSEHWQAMAAAVLEISENESGYLVTCIDRAIIQHLQAIREGNAHA